jgi:molecular chaperone GrpE
MLKKWIKKTMNMPDQETTMPENEPIESPETQQTATETEGTEIHPLEAKVAELQQQLDEARNKQLYLLSDFENYKRNAARERKELIDTAGRDVIAALLPVLDDFERAAKNGGLSEGVALVQHKLLQTLQNKGLRQLPGNPGEPFNADHHEAVAEVPAASEELKGKIVDTLEPGYAIGERIIRFAKVVVGK